MPLIVWVVHFAWAHEAEGWFGGYSCVPLRSNYRRQDGAAALWDSSVKPGIAPARHRRSAWDNTAFILHQRLVLFVWRESVRSLQPVFCPGFFFFPISLLEVENWRGLHMIPVWSCFCEVLSFCGDVKRNRHQNLNVDARRDASVRLLFFFFLPLQLNNHFLFEPLGLNEVIHVIISAGSRFTSASTETWNVKILYIFNRLKMSQRVFQLVVRIKAKIILKINLLSWAEQEVKILGKNYSIFSLRSFQIFVFLMCYSKTPAEWRFHGYRCLNEGSELIFFNRTWL